MEKIVKKYNMEDRGDCTGKSLDEKENASTKQSINSNCAPSLETIEQLQGDTKYQKKIQRIMDTIPGLGAGDNEPVIFKMDGDKVIEIIGGKHRTFAAFLKNSEPGSDGKIKFNPTKIKAYVGKV